MTCYLRFTILFFSAIFWALASNAATITVSADDDYDQILDAIVITPALIRSVQYVCDTACSDKELQALTTFATGAIISRSVIREAIVSLFYKNKFCTITFDLSPDSNGGVHLRCALESYWTLRGVKIKGIWVGRDWYRQFYLLEPGDIFDEHKHEHSVQAIKDACKQDGFFDVVVESVLAKDDATKTMQDTVYITKGTRFKIDQTAVTIEADESVGADEIAILKKALTEKYTKKLPRSMYSKRSLQELTKAMKRHVMHRGFLSTSIDLLETIHHQTKRVSVTWHIKVYKKRDFIFFGNSFFTNAQLLDRMLQFGRSAWILPSKILAEELSTYYYAQGFWHAVIETREERQRSFFVIKEGPRAWIERVELIHAERIAPRTIVNACFSHIRHGGYFDQEYLDRALEEVVSFYVREGFLESSIFHHDYIPGSKRDSYILRIVIKEGVRSYIRTVSIPGYEELEAMGPFARIKSAPQKTLLHASLINEQKQWLLDYFHKQGFCNVVLQSENTGDGEQGITITWHVTPKKKVVFGKTIVQGAHDDAYAWVTRALCYREGDIWDQARIHQTFSRLKELELFDFVSCTPLAIDEGGVRPLLIKVRHDDPFEVRLRAGAELQHVQQYQTFNGVAYRVGGTFIAKDITHHADQCRIDLDFARSHREIAIKYTYPWPFSLPCNGLLQGYSTKYEQPGFIGSSKNIYTIYQNGFLGGVRHKNSHIEIGFDAGFEFAQTALSETSDNTSAYALCISQALDLNPRILGDTIPFLFAEPTLIINRLDNSLNPKAGTFSLVSLKGLFPTNEKYRNTYCIKIMAEHSWFLSVKEVIAAFRVRIGHLFHRVFADIIPSERFYLGGAHSIRSYEADLAPPLGSCTLPDGTLIVLPRGGKTMFNANIELRIPLWQRMYGVVFQDIGLLSGDSFLHDAGPNFAAGTGFGVRYITPVGPLRFDVAWKWKKNVPTEGLFNWFLTFGQAF